VRILLVHHADAVGPDVDPQRPLSSRGHAQARDLVERFSAACAGVTGMAAWAPAAIWHSGKLRARQTAEAFLTLNPFAEFKMVRGLRPDDPPEIMLGALADATRDLVLVGHLPYLPALRQRLVAADSTLPVFPRHGLVLIERAADGWQERLMLGSDLSPTAFS
jgi:phosphohistidine phosphatase